MTFTLLGFLWLKWSHLVNCQYSVSIGSTCSHFGCNPNSFHYFFFTGTFPHCLFSMATYAIRTLCYMGYCHSNKFFRFFRKRTFFKNSLAEILECFHCFRCESSSHVINFFCCFWI